MIKIFIPNTIPTQEIINVIKQIQIQGYDKNQAFIGTNFNTFTQPLQKGDVAVVYSLHIFASITEILDTAQQLNQKGVELRSMQEPWFQNPKIEPKELMKNLFELGNQLHQNTNTKRTRRLSITKQNEAKRTAERVAKAVELVQKKQMKIIEACQTAGCSLSSYYSYKKP